MTEAKSFGCVIYDTMTLVISCRCTSYQAVALHLVAGVGLCCLAGQFQDRLGIPASLDLVILISKMVNT
jgi:hypothetical protein